MRPDKGTRAVGGKVGMEAQDHRDVADAVDEVAAEWGRERPDLDVRPIAVFARLARARTLAEQRIEAVLAESSLTLASFDVLASLRRAGSPFQRTPTELAAKSLLTSGGITFRLDRLEEAGLIERVPSTNDRRVMYAQLTEAGLRATDEAMTAHIANERRMLGSLADEEVAELARLLRKLEYSIELSDQGDGSAR